jgi:hypothetical protein
MMSGIVPGSRQGPSVVALSPWVVGSSSPVPVPPGATHVRYALAPALSPYQGVGPVVGAMGRLFEIYGVDWAADGVYSVGFDGDPAVVADVVADSLADAEAVLDFLAAGIASAYPALEVQRASFSPPTSPDEVLYVWAAMDQPSGQASATGTGAQISVRGTCQTGTVPTVAVVDTRGVVYPLGGGSSGLAGGEVVLGPDAAAVLTPLDPDPVSGDTGIDPLALVWLQFLRRS